MARPSDAPTKIATIMITNEITRPAIARPRGARNTPINEKSKPRNQRIRLRTGTQQNTRPQSARIKPATPKPLERRGA